MFLKSKYHFPLLLIGLLNFWLPAFNQESKNIPTGVLHHYSTDDGLSHSGVMCMLQDRSGFMWFGTWDGLNKFDGYKFTNYKSKPGDGNSLSHNRIDEIKEDNQGFLWVRTYDEKVHRFDRRSESFQPVHFDGGINAEKININKIISTRSGNIWFKTNKNGCFRILTKGPSMNSEAILYSDKSGEDSLRIPDNDVSFIKEDSLFNIWIGTQKGLFCVNWKKYQSFLNITKGFSVTCSEEQYNTILFGSQNGKIFRMNQITGESEVLNIPGSPAISSISFLRKDILLLGTTNKGLLEYNTDKNSVRSVSGIGTNEYIQSFYTDNYGLVWIETSKPGIYRYNVRTGSIKHFQLKTDKVSPFVYYGDYFTIFEDVNEFLWINLKGGGFCFYNRELDEVQYFYNEPGSPNRLYSNLVTFALSDANGNLWLSTHSRGLEKICFIHDKFYFHQPAPGSQVLSSNEVRAVFEDSRENLWVSTKEGKLYCYDKARKLKKIFSNETNQPGDIFFNGMVYSIIEDRNGIIWLGTKGDGIIRAVPIGNKEQLKFKTDHFRHNSNDIWSISNNWIYNIFEDSLGRIWVGTYGGGLNLLDKSDGAMRFINYNNSWKNYPRPICDKIRFIQEGNNGKIWIGSTNGLVIVDPTGKSPESFTFNLYQKESDNKNSLANNDVHYILRSKSGQLWISTFGGGLSKLIKEPVNGNLPEFKNYTTLQGLPIDIVLGILEDGDNNLWLSTENGLSKFNQETEEFINFTELDGIKKLIFSEAACYKSHRGELFFGSYDGYYSFMPQDISKENRFPKVVLVNFQLFNRDVIVGEEDSPLKQSISLTQSLTLKYNQSVFSIEYSGLDYRNTDKLEYAFKLVGFEKEWNYVKFQRKATYTNLPPGKYKFLVMCSSTGIFNESKFQQLEIQILPPWWKTKWAYLGYLVIIVVITLISRRIVLEIIRLRNKVIIEQKLTELKLRFFTNISHELRTPLTLIMGPVEDLIKKEKLNSQGRYYLEIIDKNARRMLRNINHLLDFRKIETGNMRLKIAEVELISFVNDIYCGFKELAASRSIDFTFSADVKEFYNWIDPEKIDTVIFNLLSNAFKFTPEGRKIELSLSCSLEEGFVRITVKDEGSGITKEDIPQLFERFAISHKAEGFNTKGTGIGLSLVKEIVQLHKGKVSVDSKLGEGSKFTVELPVGKDHFSKADADIEVLADRHNIHSYHTEDINTISDKQPEIILQTKENAPLVLIVEDNSDLRNYIKISLTQEYNVIEAIDGIDGIKKATSHIPDLIISDIMMPGLDGIELVNRLRNEFTTSHVPIILLTAKSTIENIIEGIKYGADAYITKPFSMELLVTRVSALIGQRKKLMERFNNQVKIVDLSPDEIVVTAKDEQFLKEVLKIIEENMSDADFHIEKIASTIGLGRTTFFKKLKSLTGFAPVEFMREMRLKRGFQLLESAEYTVSEVAYMLGFSDAGYFTKCFKEKYNITPTEVIKKSKKQ